MLCLRNKHGVKNNLIDHTFSLTIRYTSKQRITTIQATSNGSLRPMFNTSQNNKMVEGLSGPERRRRRTPQEKLRDGITAARNLLVLHILHAAVVPVDDVPVRQALRAVELMRLQHAHPDINDAVRHAINIHQPGAVLPAVFPQECQHLLCVLFVVVLNRQCRFNLSHMLASAVTVSIG